MCTDFIEQSLFRIRASKKKAKVFSNILQGTNVRLITIVLLHELYFLRLPVDAIYFHLNKSHENIIIFTFLPVKCFIFLARSSQRAPFTRSHTHSIDLVNKIRKHNAETLITSLFGLANANQFSLSWIKPESDLHTKMEIHFGRLVRIGTITHV